MVNSNRLLSDTILFIRNTLRTNITDPLGSDRPSGQRFVFTSYPKEKVVYPIITVRGRIESTKKMGQCSEKAWVNLVVEVRIWARNEKEKNNLQDDVYDHMRTNEYPYSTVGTSLNAELTDFGLNFANDLDDDGDEGVKSKLSEYRYGFIAT